MQRDYQPSSPAMRAVFAASAVVITAAIAAFIGVLADNRFTHAVLAAGSIVVVN